MAFTDWSTLRTAILDDITAGRVLMREYETANGHRVQFRNLDEVTRFLDFTDRQSAVADEGLIQNLAEFA